MPPPGSQRAGSRGTQARFGKTAPDSPAARVAAPVYGASPPSDNGDTFSLWVLFSCIGVAVVLLWVIGHQRGAAAAADEPMAGLSRRLKVRRHGLEERIEEVQRCERERFANRRDEIAHRYRHGDAGSPDAVTPPPTKIVRRRVAIDDAGGASAHTGRGNDPPPSHHAAAQESATDAPATSTPDETQAPDGAAASSTEVTARPTRHIEPTGDNSPTDNGDGGDGATNVRPEGCREEDECNFKHRENADALPDESKAQSPEAQALLAAFKKYSREDPSHIPVYGTACIGQVDCKYVRDQIKSLDTGLGHFIVVQNSEPQRETTAIFEQLAELFPNRFTFLARPQVLSCSESWNVILRLGYSIRPEPDFVWVFNGDLWALHGQQAKFAAYMRKTMGTTIANRFVHFSSYGLNKHGWKQLGPFDEVIFPAYAEDVEYHLRAVSKGVMIGSYPDRRQDVTFKHAGQRSFADKSFGDKWQRWDKSDYMYRKWGVNMRQHADFQRAKPHKHPFNIPELTHRNSFVVDPVHRECIRTGKGPRHDSRRGGCMNSICNSCFWNATVLRKILPDGVAIPEKILSQKRLMS